MTAGPSETTLVQLRDAIAALGATLERIEVELRRIADAQAESQRLSRFGAER